MNWTRWRQIAPRRIKRGIEWLIFGAFDGLALLGQRQHPVKGRVAIVHLELLGDALLWLPYGQALIRHLQAGGAQITVIADPQVLSAFAQCLGGGDFIPLNRQEFIRSWSIRRRLLRELRRLGVEWTFQSSSPRDALVHDAVVRALGATAWGFDSTHTDRPWFDRLTSRRLYQCLVPELPGVHQNVRQRFFLQTLGVDLCSVRPADLPPAGSRPLAQPYWVIAPGGSRAFRQWPVKRFAAVAQQVLRERPGWRCVILGSQAERTLGVWIASELGGAAVNLVGETTLPEMLDWIAHAQLVLGNDSGAGHIAAAFGTPSVVVTGGGHWGRCFPYDPQESPMRHVPLTIGHAMPCFGCDWICDHTTHTDSPFPCISAITVEAVWQGVEKVLAEMS